MGEDRGGGSGPRSDAELLRLARAGDREAFAELCARHRASILAVARRIVKRPQDADDVLQDIQLRFWLALGAGKITRGPGPWLLRVARNRALDLVRSAAGSRTVQFPENHDPGAAPGTWAGDLDDKRLAAEALNVVLGCKAQPHEILCFLLVNFHQYKPSDVADEYSKTPLATIHARSADLMLEIIDEPPVRAGLACFEARLAEPAKLVGTGTVSIEGRTVGATELEHYYESSAHEAEITGWWSNVRRMARREFVKREIARSGGKPRSKSAGAGN